MAHETITPLITKDLAGFSSEQALMYTVDFPPGFSSPTHRHNASGYVTGVRLSLDRERAHI